MKCPTCGVVVERVPSAGRLLDTWCTSGMRSTLEPIKKVAKSLRRHRNLILNWFQAKGTISAGVVEGLNGVVKLTTRKAFGFRTAKGIEIALFHVLGPASGAGINPQILLRRPKHCTTVLLLSMP